MGQTVGYARTSTLDQVAGYESQLRDLEGVGCSKLFKEQVSAVGSRPALAACLDYLREGDTLVVTKLDRLARSVMHLGEIVAALTAKGAALRVLNIGLDTSTPTGKLLLNMLGSVAEFERDMMLERQREGIALARKQGKYRGRKKALNPEQVQQLRQRVQAGEPKATLARELGISRETLYQYLERPEQS